VLEQEGRVIDGLIVNQTNYLRETLDGFAPYGVRIDQWLNPGSNEIDLYSAGHSSFGNYWKNIPMMKGEIRSVRLEMYD